MWANGKHNPRKWYRKRRVLPCLVSIAVGTAFFVYVFTATLATGRACSRELGAEFYAACSPQIIWDDAGSWLGGFSVDKRRCAPLIILPIMRCALNSESSVFTGRRSARHGVQ